MNYELIVDSSGTKHYYLNNKRNREDGPAIEYVDGTKCWFINGQRHRVDGPAIYRGRVLEYFFNWISANCNHIFYR